MNFIAVLLVFSFASGSYAQTPDLFGYSSNSTNAYVLQNTDGKVVDVSIQQNEVSRVLLTEETGAVRDNFGRITWFDDQARIIVRDQPGQEFKLTSNLLATFTKLSFAKVFNRKGEVVFSTHRPLTGISISDHRISWIDDSTGSLELRDLKSGRIQNYPFVKNAWLSDGFLMTQNGDRFQLYGRDQKQFPTEKASDFQLSDDLAVLTTPDGRVKVYTPDGWRFTRADVKRVVLTQYYLALSDATGIDVYHRDGSFAARYSLGTSADYNNRVIAIRQRSGEIILIDPTGPGNPLLKLIGRAERLTLSAKLAVVNNGSFFEVYSLENASFGKRLYGGSRVNDLAAATVVGLREFGFINPQAKSAQLWIPRVGAASSLESDAIKPVLDQTFVRRVDVSVEAPSLNWTMF